MRKKQCATRRLCGSDNDEDEEVQIDEAKSEAPSATLNRCPRQPAPSATSIINGQLEDGTVIVQPQPAAADADEDFADAGSCNGGRVSQTSVPGIYDTVKCTACGKKVNPYNGTMQVHPLLKVLVCHKCFKYYASGCFDVDQDGKENQCRWCGEGGSLICCDQCEHSFCRMCIKRNLGRSALQHIESLPETDAWYCYSCDQTPLKDLQEEANIVMKAVRDHYRQANRRSEKHKATAAKKASPLAVDPIAIQPASFLGLHLDLSAVPKVATKLPLQPMQAQRNASNVGAASNGSRGSSTQMTEQWYKKNVKVESILADIESVDTQNIGVALTATVALLQGMMRQYSRFIQDLAAAKADGDKAQVVSRFKSAYRMHLFLRLGKLRSLITEEERHSQRKGSASHQLQQQLQHQLLLQQQPLAQQQQQQQARPAPQTVGVIDLTGDSSCGFGEQEAPVAAAGLQLPLMAACSAADCVPPPLSRQPPDNSSEIVVVLSDEEDTQDSCGSGAAPDRAKKQKPAAILELLEQRRQREKSRKLPQPRKITLPATNRRQSDTASPNGDSPSAGSPALHNSEPDASIEEPPPDAPSVDAVAAAGDVASSEPCADADAEDPGGGGSLPPLLRKRPHLQQQQQQQRLPETPGPAEKRPRQETNSQPAAAV